VTFWAGTRVRGNPSFGIKKDGTTDWEAAYYNG